MQPTPPSRPARGGGVYVHVPFCASICSYCHFARTDHHDAELRRRTVEATLAELDLRRDQSSVLRAGLRPVDTLYIGGGTPSILEAELFRDLLDGLRGRLNLADDAEVTAEANPESFDEDTAITWSQAGVNRVSLGVQSLRDGTLDLLGRAADAATTRAALERACAHFDRVSADWILAPGVTPEALAAEFAEARVLGVGHISFYILEWHAGTALTRAAAEGRIAPDPDERVEAVYLAALSALNALGYEQYEVSNACLPGQESRHNSAYWRRRPYLGLGPGAHGFWGRRRHANHAETDRYLAAIDAGRLPEASWELLDGAAGRLEAAILALRTSEGVDLDRLAVSEEALAAGCAEELWVLDRHRLRLTSRGFLRIDAIEAWLSSRVIVPARCARVDTSGEGGLPCRDSKQHHPNGTTRA